MITSPRLGIGLPVYNGERFLEETVESILSQSFDDFELVISDNCSSDGTRAICEKLVVMDQRVRYYRNVTNIGLTANYNAAFQRSRGEFFKWSSSSDICGKDMLAQCVAALDANPRAVLAFPKTRLFETNVCDSSDYDDRMQLEQPSAYARFNAVLDNLRLNNVMNGVIRRSTLAKTKLHGPFLSSDGIMLVELALRGTFVEVDSARFYRRMSRESTTTLRGYKEIVEYWVPGQTTELRFQHWRYMIALHRAVLRARLGFIDTARATLSVLRRMAWGRNELLEELRHIRPRAIHHKGPVGS